MEEPVVSIIIPVYNSELYIEDTIKSIVNQTYTNFEAIFVDDCSTDKSLEIIKKYCDIDNRFKIIKLPRNRGPAIARNIGIRKAKGSYLTFLDSDDIWHSNKLKMQIKYITQNNYEIVYCSYRYISDDGKKISTYIKIPSVVDYKKSLSNMYILTATIMIDLKKIPKRYVYMSNIIVEDVATWWKLLKKGYKAHCQNIALVYCRKRNKSRSSNKLKNFKGRWCVYRKYEKIGIIKSCYYFIMYVLKAFNKRRKKMYNIENNNLQVLLSTRNLQSDEDVKKIISRMKINTEYKIINQIMPNSKNKERTQRILNKNVITKEEMRIK